MNVPRPLEPVLAIATTTFREAIRNRILYVLALFALAMILFSAVLSLLTLGYQVRIVTDVSLSAVTFACTTIAVLLGVSSVARELDRRTCYPVLAKPIGRATFVLGKWLGVVGVTWLLATVMVALATVMIAAYSHDAAFQYPAQAYLTVHALTLLRLGVVSAIAVSASTFAGATVATMATLTVVTAGYFTFEVRWFLERSDSEASRFVGRAVYHALPDFAALDGLPRLLYGDSLALTDIGSPVLYGIAWSALVLAAACAFFARRDLS